MSDLVPDEAVATEVLLVSQFYERIAGKDYLALALTTRQAAQVLGISPRKLEAWRANGGGPTFVQEAEGSKVVYLVADLIDFLVAYRRKMPRRPDDLLLEAVRHE